MKKKFMIIGILVIILAVGLFLYFKPLTLSHVAEGNQKILITSVEIDIENGVPDMTSNSYSAITEEQKNDVVNLLGEYSYHRTFDTVFSDGSLTGQGNELIHLFIYEGSDLVHTVSISSTGSISVNYRTYVLSNAPELIDRLLEIMSE